MSDECCGFCCLCCACFGLFGRDGCMDCGCCQCLPKPKGKELEEIEMAARAKEYELFTQAQPGPHPPPSTTVITAADLETVNGVGEKQNLRHLQEPKEIPVRVDRIMEHEDRLRGNKLEEMDTSPEIQVKAQALGSSLPVVTDADPEKLIDNRPTEIGLKSSGGDKGAKTFEEEFPKDKVAEHKEKAEEYYYWGGGGSS